ncbi:MAG: hypothetical protein ABEH61_02250, partial [Haloarculaceae archaeon]
AGQREGRPGEIRGVGGGDVARTDEQTVHTRIQVATDKTLFPSIVVVEFDISTLSVTMSIWVNPDC